MFERRSFDFYSPSKLVFETSPHKIAEEVKKFGNRFLILNLRKENHNPVGLKSLRDSLNARTSGCIAHEEIIGLPDTEQIDSAAFFTKRSHVDAIIAYGGIETMNAAKAIALLANNSFFAAEMFDQTEQTIQNPLPVITIPIMPCLGEEVTGFFSLVDANTNARKIMSSERLFPKICFIDPTLCNFLKQDDAAQIGGAMLATALECLMRTDNNLLSDAILFKSIDYLYRELPNYYKDPGHERVIRVMYWVSLMIGMAMMHQPNGLNWALAQVMNIETKLNYQQALSVMLPYVLEYNLTNIANKLVLVARYLNIKTEDVSVAEAAIMVIEAVRQLFMNINLPTNLSEFYINKDHISKIALDVSKFTHLENLAKRVSAQEIESILLTAL